VRTEQLLANILPAQVAADFARDQRVEPQKLGNASLVLSGLILSRPRPWSLTNHCFKAFDAIVARHQLVKVRTVGSGYLAAGVEPDNRYPWPRTARRRKAARSCALGKLLAVLSLGQQPAQVALDD
jgi:hypothetical protein